MKIPFTEAGRLLTMCSVRAERLSRRSASEKETLSYKSYLFTKVVRFLLLQTVVSQNMSKKNFCFIPDLGKYEGTYTDKLLCKMWGISDKEYDYIRSRIGEIGEENVNEN